MSLWYPDTGPPHLMSGYANMCIPWCGTDSEHRFKENSQVPHKFAMLKSLGFSEPDCIQYAFNHQGFRCEQFDNRPAGIALGCSFTQGIGLPLKDTWVSVLSGLLGQHIWNLGIGGSGADTSFRILDHYINVLTPKFVVMCIPSSGRIEFFDRHERPRTLIAGHLNQEPHSKFAQEWMESNSNTGLNRRRNLLAIAFICHEKNIPFFSFDSQTSALTQSGRARDLAHPGAESNHIFAHTIHETIKDAV